MYLLYGLLAYRWTTYDQPGRLGILTCINISHHTLMGRPYIILETMVLVLVVHVCYGIKCMPSSRVHGGRLSVGMYHAERGIDISAAINYKWDGFRGARMEGLPFTEIWHRYP